MGQTSKKLTNRPQNTAKRLTLSEKILIRAAKNTGQLQSHVAREYGVSDNTVKAIWKNGELAKYDKEVAVIKENFANKLIIAADASLNRVVETISDASVSQAAMTMGICYDKYRLSTNQSTQNHSVHAIFDVVNKTNV